MEEAAGVQSGRIFLTGATGYIGGRLAPRLLEAGLAIRCLTRSRAKLKSRPWATAPGVEIVEGDAGDEELLARSMVGCEVAYYLVHSMVAAGSEYAERDRVLAETFSRAALRAGVERIVYLGGLGETGLSRHLASRREVEEALVRGSDGRVPVTVLRAAMIIGSGSASFEILRYLVERLPVMITPRWVRQESQPIAVRDVLVYLVEVLRTPETIGATLDIGGSEVASYEEIMQTMAEAMGLPRRLVIRVPVLTPRLSSLWIHLVTPLDARIARPLAEGLRNRVVVRDDRAARLMPRKLLSIREAIDAALVRVRDDAVETKWSDAGVMPGDPAWAGGTEFEDRREAQTRAPVEAVWAGVSSLGGVNGYYGVDWLWRVRGWMDRLAGGPGLRRGRRSSGALFVGDALDFWRVTGVEAPHALELTAEMRLPGRARLSFELKPEPNAGSRVAMTARFRPRGLAGILYWFAVLPFHGIVFNGMLRGLLRAAEDKSGEAPAARAAGADA